MQTTLSIAVVQLRPEKGNYEANVRRVGSIIAELVNHPARPEVVHFPEAALSGYFLEGGVRDVAVTAATMARDVDEAYRDALATAANSGFGEPQRPIEVVVGFYELWRETLHNSSAYIRLGDSEGPTILHVHRKVFLPTYGLFDEERFVERGHDIRAFDTSWGRAAMLICEDAWHSLSATIAAIDNADVIFVSAATPARGIHAAQAADAVVSAPSTVTRWERLLREMAEEHSVFVSFTNLVGSEGGKVFAGCASVHGPRGDVQVKGPLWEETALVAELKFSDVARARADTPLLSDLRTVLPHLRRSLDAIERSEPAVLAFDGVATDGIRTRAPDRSSDRAATIPIITAPPLATLGGPPPLEIDADLVERWLIRFLRDEMAHRGMKHAVVGVSGGVDSAVTAFLAARALGPERVLGVRLPYRTSSPASLEHAQLVIDALGIRSRTIDISQAVDGYLAHESDAGGGRRGNVMARTRMIVLFDQSAREEGVPLGTGNKSERLFGYFTWHADDSPPINPVGDLFKTQVWALARHLGVPDVIINKPASADLIEGQTDESDFGISYAVADQILNWIVAGYSAAEIVKHGFAEADVRLVKRRVDGTHWKRRLPTVAMLSHNAIGESYLRPVDY